MPVRIAIRATAILIILASVANSRCVAIAGEGDSDNGKVDFETNVSFWDVPAESASDALPENGIYPHGRIFPFTGFSAKPQRAKAAGYSMLGPVYGDQSNLLDGATEVGLPVVYSVGIDKSELAQWENRNVSEAEAIARIREQVSEVIDNELIAWWYLIPEELRYWREHELRYLELATQAIRESDPLRRPIWLYEPNHRTAESLLTTGKLVDIVGKGSYTNYAGHQKDRVWVRWSMEQQTKAIASIEEDRIPIMVAELFQDPSPADHRRIPEWVRHDVILSLIHGAKGVAVYSLFERPEVKKYFDDYYEAYAGIARDLRHNRKLGDVFLFGKESSDLKLRVIAGPNSVSFVNPASKVESASLTEQEKTAAEQQTYPALSSCEYRYRNKRYLFLCNSSYDESITVEVKGFPTKTTLVTEAFSFNFLHPRVRHGVLKDVIPGLGVRCFVFSKFSPVGR